MDPGGCTERTCNTAELRVSETTNFIGPHWATCTTFADKKSAFCPRGKHYHCHLRLFVLQAALKRQRKIKSASAFIHFKKSRHVRDPVENYLPIFYLFRWWNSSLYILNGFISVSLFLLLSVSHVFK